MVPELCYSVQLNLIPNSSIILKSSMQRTPIASQTCGILIRLLFAAVGFSSFDTTHALSAMACAISHGSASDRCFVLSTSS